MTAPRDDIDHGLALGYSYDRRGTAYDLRHGHTIVGVAVAAGGVWHYYLLGHAQRTADTHTQARQRLMRWAIAERKHEADAVREAEEAARDREAEEERRRSARAWERRKAKPGPKGPQRPGATAERLAGTRNDWSHGEKFRPKAGDVILGMTIKQRHVELAKVPTPKQLAIVIDEAEAMEAQILRDYGKGDRRAGFHRRGPATLGFREDGTPRLSELTAHCLLVVMRGLGHSAATAVCYLASRGLCGTDDHRPVDWAATWR